MQTNTPIMSIASMLILGIGSATTALADDLTKMVEQDLSRLGYETGLVDGEETIETTIAITKFQADNNLEITGEVSPQLARALMAADSSDAGSAPAPAAAGSAAATPAPASAAAPAAAAATDPTALQAAQQACLQRKMEKAQKKQKKKRGLSRLMSAVSRTASRKGNYDVARTANDVYYAGATADDLSAAAKDLGLTEDDITACENPQ